MIDWGNPQAPARTVTSRLPGPIALIVDAPRSLVQRLPWDFTTTFPQRTDEAIDAGVVDESDTQPEKLKSLHNNYARQCLATLEQLDNVLDARRRGVDPKTGEKPRTHASRERLRTYLDAEPEKLEHEWRVLIETYENAFGPDAAQAFSKCIRARHNGIPVELDHAPAAEVQPQHEPSARMRRSPAVLPVPKPLPEAIAAKHFGEEEDGKPVRPNPTEVRTITENHVERLIDVLDTIREHDRWLAAPGCADRARLESERNRNRNRARLKEMVDLYAGSFGHDAAERLEAYARRQVLIQTKEKIGQLR